MQKHHKVFSKIAKAKVSVAVWKNRMGGKAKVPKDAAKWLKAHRLESLLAYNEKHSFVGLDE